MVGPLLATKGKIVSGEIFLGASSQSVIVSNGLKDIVYSFFAAQVCLSIIHSPLLSNTKTVVYRYIDVAGTNVSTKIAKAFNRGNPTCHKLPAARKNFILPN